MCVKNVKSVVHLASPGCVRLLPANAATQFDAPILMRHLNLGVDATPGSADALLHLTHSALLDYVVRYVLLVQ